MMRLPRIHALWAMAIGLIAGAALWPQVAAAQTIIRNTAWAATQNAAGTSFNLPSNQTQFTRSDAVQLTFAAAASPNPVTAGELITYTLNYLNSGNVALTGVLLTLRLPPTSQAVFNDSSPPVLQTGDTVSVAVGALATGQSGTVTVTARVLSTVATGVSLLATAGIDSNETEPQSLPLAVAVLNGKNALRVDIRPDREIIELGESVIFTVTVENLGGQGNLSDIFLYTEPPEGFEIAAKTAHLESEAVKAKARGPGLLVPIGTLAPGEKRTFQYRAAAGPGALAGDEHASAYAERYGRLASNQARCRVKVTSGLLAENGVIVGKVFVDENQDRLQNNGEPGLPGVGLFMENGIHVVTDSQGKYSVPEVTPGLHVIEVDRTTLPAWATLAVLTTRMAGDPASQFVEVSGGGIYKANFRVLPYRGKVETSATRSESHGRIVIDKTVTVAADPSAPGRSSSNRADWRLSYQLELNYQGGERLSEATVVDLMSSQIVYRPGSSRLDGHPIPDPALDGATLSWPLPDLKNQDHHTLTYEAALSPNAAVGALGNQARVRFRDAGGGEPILSEPASAPVELTFSSESVRLFFDSAQATLRPESTVELDRVAKFLQSYPDSEIFIEGYADNRALRSLLFRDNDELSMARAQAVADYLIAHKGADPARIHVVGNGERNPVAPNTTAENLQQNRRAQVNMGMFVLTAAPRPDNTRVTEFNVAGSAATIGSGPSSIHLLPGDKVEFRAAITLDPATEVTSLEVRHIIYPGSRYLSGSSRLNGLAVADPVMENGVLLWQIPAAGRQFEFTYRAEIIADKTADPPAPPLIACYTRDHEKILATGDSVRIFPGSVAPMPPPAAAAAPDALADLQSRIESLDPALDILEPAEGQLFGMGNIRVLVKGAANHRYHLFVNEREIDAGQVGRTLSSRSNNVAVIEYVNVELKPGRNLLVVRTEDQFGIARGEVTRTVILADKPAKMELTVATAEVPADGRSEMAVTLTLADQDGNPVQADQVVTVSAGALTILDADDDPKTVGHQLKVTGGKRTFQVRAPVEPGEHKLVATLGKLSASAPVSFLPHLREMIVVGLGEGTIGYRSVQSHLEPVGPDDHFETGVYTEGRMSLFLKGKVKEKYLVTAAYDSDGNLPNREKIRDPDPERYYPVYGDASIMNFEAQSTADLYVKIERDRSHVLFGDFNTGFTANSLARWDRVLTGGQATLQDHGRKARLDTYVAPSDRRLVVDDLPGLGISGYYFLSAPPVVMGSERVEIQVRDRDAPDRVLSTRPMKRNLEYGIDYQLGTIMFLEPVSAEDENFNPVVIRVVYESIHGSTGLYQYGAQGEVEVYKGIRLGGTFVQQQLEEGENSSLSGAHAEVALPGNTKVRLEEAQSSDPMAGEGSAVRVAVDSTPSPRIDLHASMQNVTEDFVNPLSAAQPDTETSEARGRVRLTDHWAVFGRWFSRSDGLAEIERESTEAGVETEVGKAKLGASVRLLDNEYGDFTTGRVFAGAPLTDRFTLKGEYEQALNDPGVYVAGIGGDYRLGAGTRVFLRQQFISSEDGTMGLSEETRRQLFVAGIESKVGANTNAFGRYEIEDAISGEDAYTRIGLNHRLSVNPTTTMDFRVERRDAVEGDGTQDFTAVAVGAAYTPHRPIRLTGNVEFRWGEIEESRMARVGAVTRLNQDWSLLARGIYYESDLVAGDGGVIKSRSGVGMAYRPVENDSVNLLWRLESVTEASETAMLDRRSDRLVGMVDLNWQPTADLELMSRYAGKQVLEDSLESQDGVYLDYMRLGVYYDLNPKVQVGVNYRALNCRDTGDSLYGYGGEVGYLVSKNLWLAGGYNLEGFVDEDFSVNDYTAAGPYLRLRMKVDRASLPDWP